MFLHEVATLNMIYMVDVLNRIASVALTPVSHVTIAYGRYDRYYHKTVITMITLIPAGTSHVTISKALNAPPSFVVGSLPLWFKSRS